MATNTPISEPQIRNNTLMHDTKEPVQSEESLDRVSEEAPSENVQNGVRQAEAITITWSKKSLITAYSLMWLLYFINGMQASITSNLSPYVTSDFSSHSLLPVISIVSSVMAAATYMPLAKVLNLFDRSVGFVIMVTFATIGLVLSATCQGIATYCAAQVFYSVGFVGMTFSIDVITADTSTLRDRGLAYAFTSSPYIISAFAGPKASEGFNELDWRWAYGAFSIILPCVATPMFLLLRYNRRLAIKSGILKPREKSGRTFLQSVKHYVIEFDLLGTFLLAAGLVLLLLPFNIAQSSADQWRNGGIIAMLVLGVVCLISFALVEKFVAPVPFLPWEILISRTVLGLCLQDATYQIAYYCWNGYYTSYLQVVYGVSLASAGYINSIFDVVSGLWLFAVGYAIRRTRRFRWLLFFAVPLYLLGVGLMIYFRRPSFSVGYMIMCAIFIAFAGGTMIIVQQVGVLSMCNHDQVASGLAFLGVFGNSGGAIGSSISGGIWTNVLPGALARYLPEDAQASLQDIYDSLDVQLSYERGSATRDAIALAYSVAQQKMLIAGTAVMGLSLIWIFVIRDVKITKTQSKGVLF